MNTFLIQEGDLKPVRISRSDCLKQRLEIRFRLWKGEWEFDKLIGFSWENVIRRNPIVKEVESLVRSELRKDPEVVSIDSVEVIFIDTEEKATQYEKPLRTAIIRYIITSTYGSVKGEI
ncbi:hypothetical protein LEP1GSC188_3419 [Leptospira weilii serovar Topaz str. LT2116]|uniref:PF10934 family protein n=1 Tax=Leptospira weilii serovar Topaz str. LT2116 TaxID=1088540 RepID=M3FP84_9LEPT|nr:hypothetical protein LEP1GSC188_3419 [Leptospira weilii serovar Topaz str. LT2116]